MQALYRIAAEKSSGQWEAQKMTPGETNEENLHPLGSICPQCGNQVSRGQYLCNDCDSDRNDGNGCGLIYGLPNWCRLRDCDYDCKNCKPYRQERDDKNKDKQQNKNRRF